MATFVVDTLNDEAFDGSNDATDGDGLSLREALALANANPDTDTIVFDSSVSGGTLRLTQGTSLSITSNVTIDGDIDNDGTPDITISGDVTGNDRLTTDRNGNVITDISGSDLSDNARVFLVTGGTSTLDGLVITGGRAQPTEFDTDGGGVKIYNGAAMAISNSSISGNVAGTISGKGGGIFAGFTEDQDSRQGGSVTLTDSLVSQNYAGGDGGGVSLYFGLVSFGLLGTIRGTTISDNATGYRGGGIDVSDGASAVIENSTIYGNAARLGGGIVAEYGGSFVLRSSTVSDNSANPGGGSGIYGRYSYGRTSQIQSSIVADNANEDLGFYAGFLGNDPNPFVATNSLIGDGNGLVPNGSSGNIVGTANAPVDPKLGPLVNNGGLQPTMALLDGSPAIDAGANPGNLVTDQRGAGFARNSGPDFDIGAVEQQAIEKQAPVFLGDLSDRAASVTLPENSAAGTSAFDVDANDNNGGAPDANVTYKIVAGNFNQDGDANPPFAIDSATGAITVNDAGDLDFETTPRFRLTVEADNGTTTANALVTVSLSNIDEAAPVIAAQTFSFAENQSAGATLATIVATDDVAVTGFSILSGDPNDFFDIDANGVLTLTNAGVASAANDFETQPNVFSLTVQASDAAGKTTNGLMTLNVTDVLDNAPPIANLDVLATDEDTVLSGNVLLDNGNGSDSDVDGDALTVTAVNGEAANVGSQITLASGALLTVNADGTLSYDPNGQFESLAPSGFETEIATYTISDGNGGSAIGNVELRVDGINDAAIFSGDLSGSVTEDAVPNTASGTLAVTDVDGQSMVTAQTDTLGTYGSFTIDAAGAWTYTLDNADPDTNALASGDVGMDDFVVAAADGTQQTISIAINGADDAIVPPLTAVDDTFQVFEDIVFSGNVLANDVGPDLDALRSVRINDQTLPGGRALTEIALANGTLAINRLGDFTYTPNAEFNGADTFSYVLRDGSGATETASVNLVVTKVEDAPVAQDDMFSTDQGQSVSGNLLADNGNGIDSDADDSSGDTLRVVTADGTAVVSAGTELSLSGGTLVVDRLGDFTYTPDAGFSGVETFTYGLAQAGGVGRDTATVTIDVAPVANQLVEGRAIKLDFRNKESILNEKADADGRANGLTFTNLERGAEVSGEGVLDRLGGNGLSVFELDSFGPNGSGPPVRVHIDDGIGIGRDRVVDEDETLSIGLTVDQANGGTFQFTKANASNRDGDFDPGETIDIHLLLDGVQVFQASYTHDPQARNSLQTLSLNELPSFHDTIVFDEAQLSAGTDETEFALRDIVFFTVVSELELA